MKIPLANSDQTAIVDDCFSEEVACQKWYLGKIGYVVTNVQMDAGKYGQIYLHHLIMGERPGLEIDHINGDKLDNRAANLRHVTRSQQCINIKLRKDNTSGHKGVFKMANGSYYAQIKLQKKLKHLGCFQKLEEAVAAREKAEEELHGEYARK